MLRVALVLFTLLLPPSSGAAPVPGPQRARLMATGKIGADVLDALESQERVRVMIAFAVPELQQRSAVPIERGTETLEANVTISWALK